MAKIGSFIDNKYEILKKIGQGGMSVVYLAMDKRLNKQWAVKELQKYTKNANNEVVIQSAIAEANMIKKLDHPALPRIVDIIEEDKVIYVVMDYIEGETLEYVVNNQGAQSQDLVIDWAKQLTEVLHYLHTRTPAIIYRDMKPSNVMLKPDGNIKVIDFGIAREYKESNLNDTTYLGTRGYAAPEQFGGKGQTDARTDIYCLGMTLYHLITGKNPMEPPYEIYPIRYWNPSLSGGLENIIEKCVQLNPKDRYQSCAELLYALEHYEEEDDAFKTAQKKKLNKFIMASISTMIFLSAGLGSIFAKNSLNKSDYNNNLLQAEKATNGTDKRNHCIKAISILPQNSEAYEKLIETYKDNNIFSVEEAIEFKEQVVQYLPDLQKSRDYGQVAYDIGRLYWYYYEYGDNDPENTQITKMINSITWFNDAVNNSSKDDDYHDTALIYKKIGTFYKELQTRVNEGASVKGLYKSYFEDLVELVEIVSDKKESEIVKLETYKLVFNSFENYGYDFKADDIKKDQVIALFNNVKKEVETIKTSSTKTTAMKDYVNSRKEAVDKAIENAYLFKEMEVD
ncbi:serine/threonine protein kinase [Thomasclavelia cocleata]|uniref:non-specific serine/threonine protein kinase n=1 Tax=Thomasclavelia cocleata TaxID=69824 RepID=A0A1I0DVI6_9FIRM|nr:serine/threonine-protein kinase [Thomasclavelia cocleata]MCR1961178.1 serine/threonine protein kinase [Thomasclavelia cocleata]NDO42090.1 serine/threonine protein kinase [Thomasclavelia cocleata]PJN80906.1 serine/threonine protein kinase [Thomasclavelia cocleata]SET36670.1 serine/threonine protein kinase [Thomasclavelia cocleata]GFI40503.1 serine/threonine-protein kinase PrkC [Thomasclavelia cocleata]